MIRPQLDRLTYSKINVPTIRGNISAEFKINGKLNTYEIPIPGNMECDLILDTTVGHTINLNGKKIEIRNGSVSLKPGHNKILFGSNK